MESSDDPQTTRLLERFDRRLTGPDGARVHWLVGRSNAAPLMLVHGDYGSWRHWHANIETLGESYRLLIPDMPGYGNSDAPFERFSPEQAATDLAATLPLAPSVPLKVVGFSLGGIVAGCLAARLGAQITHLVLSGPGGLGLGMPNLPDLERVDASAGESAELAVHRRNLLTLMLRDPQRATDLAARLHRTNIRRTRTRAWRVPAGRDLVDALPNVTAPIDAIWAGLDQYCDPARQAAVAALLAAHTPDSRFARIEAAGHWLCWEQPAEFNRILLELLRLRS